jgi:hypothetical protein
MLKKYTVPTVLPSSSGLDSAKKEMSGKLAPMNRVGTKIKTVGQKNTSTKE